MNGKRPKLKIAAIWSGGKDGCMSYFRVFQMGYKVEYLLNLINKENNMVAFHNFHKNLIKMQSNAIGMPLLQNRICSQKNNRRQFENELKKIVLRLKNKGINGISVGYVSGDYQRVLLKQLSSSLSMALIEPLYQKNSKNTLKEFIQLGFKAVIVSVDLSLLDDYWVGCIVDENFIKYLVKKSNVDFCGDRGEYHTFVIDGPIFKKRIIFHNTSKIYIKNYCFLNISKYDVIKKPLQEVYNKPPYL